MRATYGVDFWGCWRVMLGSECIGAFATSKDAKEFCERVEVGKVLVVTIGYDNDGLWVTDLGEIVSKATDGRVELTEKK